MWELALICPVTLIPVVDVSNFVELLCFNNVPAPSVNWAIVLPSDASLTLTTLPLIFKAPVPESLILLLLPSWNICKSLLVPSCILLVSFNFIPPNEPVKVDVILPLELMFPLAVMFPVVKLSSVKLPTVSVPLALMFPLAVMCPVTSIPPIIVSNFWLLLWKSFTPSFCVALISSSLPAAFLTCNWFVCILKCCPPASVINESEPSW